MLTEQQVGDHLARFEREAFRFETRDRYDSDVGRAAFRRFLAGEVDDYAWHRPWLRRVRRDTAAGKVWRRVRIVTLPLSDWSRYGMEIARLSTAAGDDTRYLSRSAAESLGVDPLDAWLLDDVRLLHLHFDRDDRFVGGELIRASDEVERHRALRDTAWEHASVIDEFPPPGA